MSNEITPFEQREIDFAKKCSEFFRFNFINPCNFAHNENSLSKFIIDSNFQYVTVKELINPYHIDVALQCGYATFLPPVFWWLRLYGLMGVHNKLRRELNTPIKINNWWRPEKYNLAVTVTATNPTGTPKSDHVTAHAFDLVLRDRQIRMAAANICLELSAKERWLRMSIGYKSYRGHLHAGVNSPRGHRVW